MSHEKRRELTEELDFALKLAIVAEEAILPRFQRCAVRHKPDGTEVTDADRAAEEAIRAAIDRVTPDYGVIGEEFGTRIGSAVARRWVVDPLDGTASFTLGLPNFGTLIALLEGDEPVVGVVHFPVMGETVYAAKGLGCWWRSAREADSEPLRISVASPVEVNEAIASATGTHSTDIQSAKGQTPYRLIPLINAVRKFRFVSDCVQHALVCRGRLHVGIDTIMSPWDTAALVPCVEEAGGVVATLDGRREGVVFGGSLISACDSELLAAVVALLRP
jgi:histidinol-phosphatase